jgi:hypothetical protein
MMSRVVIAALAAGTLVLSGSLAQAQSKGAKNGKLALVEAMCPTGVGNGVAKCNARTFSAGAANLKSAKSPAHYNVVNLTAASVQVKGLAPSPPAGLDCTLYGVTSFGDDPDAAGPADCLLANGTVGEVPGGIGTIPCVPSGSVPGGSDCKGTLGAPSTIPANCTNVKVTVENPRVECSLQGGVMPADLIAKTGLVILPGPDCTGQTQGSCK